MTQVNFSKWHGLGNDYIIIAARDLPFQMNAPAARLICDRHFGIGSDGILLWSGTEAAGFHLQIFNPDGSLAEMCGNGMRMLARYLRDYGYAQDDTFAVETAAGEIAPTVLEDGNVRVHMGRAALGGTGVVGFDGSEGEEAICAIIDACDQEYEFTFVDMGNPHCVIEVPDLEGLDICVLGPALENHERFPGRANVEFMKVNGPHDVQMRVWERGVGETTACGTGACAVAVAAVRQERASSPVTVHLPGGDLSIEVSPEMEVYMTGPAEEVYSGTISEVLMDEINKLI